MSSYHYKFKIQPQFFVDYSEIARANPASGTTTQPSLGLIDRSYYSEFDTIETHKENEGKTWERFAAYVDRLNMQSPENVSYKVLYLTRHGLGIHNVCHAKFGSDAWNNYWSHLDGDDTASWADAKLTEAGIQQVSSLSQFWADITAKEKVPLPATIYTSPLARCLETSKLVFSRPIEESGKRFQPVVKELLRERLTDHTCDKRSTRAWIESCYPSYIIESGFSDEDVMWRPDRSETTEEHVARKQQVLEDIFSTDDNCFIALTVHSYAISAILSACGSEGFRVREGSTIALLVRGERLLDVY